jgi:hypothetical protein
VQEAQDLNLNVADIGSFPLIDALFGDLSVHSDFSDDIAG